MSAPDRIIALLVMHPDGLDDDVIAENSGCPDVKQANFTCRELEREGIVERRSVRWQDPKYSGWQLPARWTSPPRPHQDRPMSIRVDGGVGKGS